MKKKHFVISTFICQTCGMKIPLPRVHGQQRENGHVKDVYCPSCKCDRKFTEIRYKESFTNLDGQVIYM